MNTRDVQQCNQADQDGDDAFGAALFSIAGSDWRFEEEDNRVTTAKLPPELRLNTPRTVSELRSGERGHITFTDLNVSENGDCFLRAPAQLRKTALNTIEVRRDDAGYHVVTPGNLKYTLGVVLLIEGKLPVASVAVGPEE
jgi:hypothetical protein